jgi:ABC-type amino acid transport substrate-binding protein
MVKRMNKYNEILDWLQNEHNEVFNQWAQIEEVMRLEAEQKEKEEQKLRWERRKEHITAQYDFLMEKYDSIPEKEDKKQAVRLSFELIFDAVKKERYDMVSTYETAIRSILKDSNFPAQKYLKDGRRVITPFHSCWSHNHSDDIKYDSNAEYDWREEE